MLNLFLFIFIVTRGISVRDSIDNWIQICIIIQVIVINSFLWSTNWRVELIKIDLTIFRCQFLFLHFFIILWLLAVKITIERWGRLICMKKSVWDCCQFLIILLCPLLAHRVPKIKFMVIIYCLDKSKIKV